MRMQLAPADPTAPFTNVAALPAKAGAAPAVRTLGWDEGPADTAGLVSVRYDVFQFGTSMQLTVRNDDLPSEPWYEVRGTLRDAVRAARELAVVEGFEDDPKQGSYARTSVAVLDAGNGAWHLSRMSYLFGAGDEMDAIISMPVDRIPGGASQVSVPFGVTPERVTVRFDDPRVAALVGVDAVAVAPGR